MNYKVVRDFNYLGTEFKVGEIQEVNDDLAVGLLQEKYIETPISKK